MAYIAPNSTVQFFGDLSLNPNYDDTLYFASTAAKDSYFDGLTKLATATALSYTREQRNFLRVELPMSTLINASYIRFKNTSFENKWFYAFVKNVEYINNNCTQVNFELDVMMTWMGAFTLHECFIERQHTITDNIGDNIIDENLPTGEYVCQGTYRAGLLTDYTICIFTTALSATVKTAAGAMYSGIYSGLHMIQCADAAAANAQIDTFVTAQNEDSIVLITMLPTDMLPDPDLGEPDPYVQAFLVPKPYTSLNGYIPRNKKLFCYPYNYLQVNNCEGGMNEYRYEYFETGSGVPQVGNCVFTIYGTINAQPEFACVPRDYKYIPKNYAEKLGMVNFPKCAWGVDSYKAYIAMQQSNLPNAVLKPLARGIGNFAGSALTGRPEMGLFSIAGGVGGALNAVLDTFTDSVVRPGGMQMNNHGTQTSDLMVALRDKDFYCYQMCLTENYARSIDSFFDMFGYSIRRRGTPNMNARPNWTYVKTTGCAIGGSIPADDARAIENIFNNGVRFWKNHNNIGNYQMNNAPA